MACGGTRGAEEGAPWKPGAGRAGLLQPVCGEIRGLLWCWQGCLSRRHLEPALSSALTLTECAAPAETHSLSLCYWDQRNRSLPSSSLPALSKSLVGSFRGLLESSLTSVPRRALMQLSCTLISQGLPKQQQEVHSPLLAALCPWAGRSVPGCCAAQCWELQGHP